MILDGHIHLGPGAPDPAGLLERLGRAGVAGGLLISRIPPAGRPGGGPADPPAARLDHLCAWTDGQDHLHPCYWIHPLDADALDQVAMAADRGVVAFKVICNNFHPGDERAMPVYGAIAATGLPILFHSGILWDGQPSSQYNRPAGFEPLLAVAGLRFSLAHISWPWCDEAIAVYGKFLNAMGGEGRATAEMFIDTTPGTPPIYRREALTRLFMTGYDVADNVIFGTDCTGADYNLEWTREWLARDGEIMAELGLAAPVQDKVLGGNLLRFLGLSRVSPERRTPRPGQ